MNIRYFLLSLILLTLGNSLKAAPPEKPFLNDNKRYMALMILNDDEDRDFVPDIQAAHDKGFNAVYLGIKWNAVKCRHGDCRTGRLPGSTGPNPSWNTSNRYWTQIDNEVAKAKQLGMKIAFRVHVGSTDYGYGTSKYLWGENSYMEREPGNPGEQGIEDLGGYDERAFSLSKQTAIDSAKNFMGEVLNRYGYLEGESNLLFVSVSMSTAQEGEYPGGNYLLDYSAASLADYNSWYQSKYGTNYPSVPTEYTSTEGKKWYTFRHKKLKEFVDQMVTKVKTYNSNIKFVNDNGSAFDALGTKRGTLGFKSLNQNTDGLKVNDDFSYDHRFSMDIIRGTLPGKFLMNEFLMAGSNPSSVYYDWINQSFAHGAKLFSVIASVDNLNAYSGVFSQISGEWLSGTMGTLPTNGTVGYTFSEILTASFNGNRFSTSSRNIYQEWLNQYNSNPAGSKPVNVVLNDDELNGCTAPGAPSLSASPSSITAGAGTNVTLSASGCSGGTITWSDGLGTGSSKTVSPAATKTYTANCSLNGCTSSNASVTVTVNAGTCDFNMSVSPSNANPATGASVTLTSSCTGANCSGLTYAWSGNGISGTSSSITFNAPGTVGTYTYTVTVSKSGCANKTASVSINAGSSSGTTTCISLGDQGSGNTSEIRSYTLNMATAGNYPLKLTYRSHDGPSVGRIRINSGSWTTFNLPQTSVSEYVEIAIGTYALTSGNNAIDLSSSTGFMNFRQLCALGGCTPPSAPGLSASPATITSGSSSTLTATGCSGGTITWSDALGTGTSKSVSPTATKTYTATCTLSGCTSPAASVTVTVGVCDFNMSATSSNQNPAAGASVTLTSACTGSNCSGLTYAWSGNNISGTGSTVTFNAPAVSGTYTYTITASKSGCVNKTGSVTITVPVSGGPTTCANLGDQGSGNSFEIRSYTLNMAAAGNYPLKLTYRSHDGASVARIRINGGTWQTFNLPQTSVTEYVEIGIGNYTLASGNNAIDLSSSSGFMNFRQLCAQTICTAPSSPGVSASPTSITSGGSSTLNATGCSGGTITWSDGLGTGTSKSVSPTATKTYTVTCTVSGCVSAAASVTVTVTPPSSSTCINLGDQGSGNSYEIRTYTLNMSSAGSRTLKLTYRSHESASVGLIRINSGSWQTYNLAQTGVTEFVETSIGSYSLNSGNNTIELASNSGFIAFRQLCAQSGGSPLVLDATPEIIQQKRFVISPNPNNGIFETSFYLEKGKKAVINIIDLQGRTIYKKSISGQGNHKEKIILTNRASGTLFVQLHKENGVEVKKISIAR